MSRNKDHILCNFQKFSKIWKPHKSIAMLNIVRYNGNIKKAHKKFKIILNYVHIRKQEVAGMKQQTRNRKNITKENSGLKNPADDDIIQFRTNVLKNQQKGKLKTKTKNEEIEAKRERLKTLYIESQNKDRIEQLFLFSI